MKLPILFLCFMTLVTPAFADVVERRTCDQVKAEIAELSAMGNLNAEQRAELNQLFMQQRSYCSVKSNGRRTVARNLPSFSTGEVAQTSKLDALTDYLTAKKSNCEKLNDEIAKLGDDSTVAWIVREMQKYYDSDCLSIPAADVVAETIAGAVVSQTVQSVGGVTSTAVAVNDVFAGKTEEEIAAIFEANLAAGLCGDGTKPNRFGCCAGETFTDLGNAEFACCPNKLSGECFPPITPIK
ncbi:MAG: hypothetical protein J6W79_02225 [Alphaproteobacteria bacterium]|nr:hypothetical protein [Alphaproteobacteria bacterium]